MNNLPIMMELDDNFFKKETRCQYNVVTKLKKIWAVELDLLRELTRVCKSNDIKFSLAFGSMLGAVRHKGFIPWDDDLDVFMTRDQFEKFLKVAPPSLSELYFLQTGLSDRSHYIPYARLRNKNTTGIVSYNASPRYNNGIFLDIYVLDGVVESKFKRSCQYGMRVLLDWICNLCSNELMTGGASKAKIIRALKFSRPLFLCIASYERWCRWYTRIVSRYSSNAKIFCPVIIGDCVRKHKFIYFEELERTVDVDFEGLLKVPIYLGYDNILRRFYGDYMKFPDEIERGKWHEGMIRFDPEISYKKIQNEED